jgi:uncharacterized protein (TIGR00266 family)
MAMTQAHGISYEFLHGGGPFTMLRVALPSGGQLQAESDAMVAMDPTIEVEGTMHGGVLGGLARKFLTNESFFFQKLTATRGAGEVLLSPGILGDLTVLELDGSVEYQLQKNGFFAATSEIEVGTKLQGLAKGLFSGAGFFVQKISGRGLLFVESFGAIHRIEIPAGQEKIIDNNHLVAWDARSVYHVEKAAAGWLSSLTSGEGLVCRFQGPAQVWIQTRNAPNFAGWMAQFLPRK